MSKFNWTELPDWKNPAHYSFFEGLSLDQKLWEHIRRDAEYRTDYAKIEQLKHEFGDEWRRHNSAYVFEPPKFAEESKEKWLQRVALNQGVVRITPLQEFLAMKWNLLNLADPTVLLGPGEIFRVPLDSPFSPLSWDEISSIPTEEIWTKDFMTGQDMPYDIFDRRFSVIVFNLQKPMKRQRDEAYRILSDKRQNLLQQGIIEKQASTAAKPEFWVRNLRALDAKRSAPPASNEEIGHELTPHSYETTEQRRGEKLVASARKMSGIGSVRLSLMLPHPAK